MNNIKERENVDLQRFLDENRNYPKLSLIEELKKDKRTIETMINNRKKGEKNEFKSTALKKLENFNKAINDNGSSVDDNKSRRKGWDR